MQHESIDGVVIRVRDVGDHDRYLSILTAQKGRITVLSKGSRSLKGQQMAVSQLYTYANFEYYRKGDFYILKGGAPIQPFYALSLDIDRLNLAAYFCDVAYEVSDEGEEAGELLRLLLNSLYALNKGNYPQSLVKGAFELRAATISGYAPELNACALCGCPPNDDFYLDVMNGAFLCGECLKKRQSTVQRQSDVYDDLRDAEVLCPVSRAVCNALLYCVSAPLQRLFSFELKEASDLGDFSTVTQTYLLSHLERGFDSLNFYHMMREGLSPVQGKPK